jgi:CBS domain-containing protein
VSVGTICNRETVIVRENESILDAAKAMRLHHVGSLVVVRDVNGATEPVGIITDRDLVIEIMATEADASAITIGDAMSFELMTARESDEVGETLQRMRERGVRRIPVLDRNGGLAGILSIDDLIEYLVEQMGDIVALAQREQLAETQRRPA